MLNFLAQLGQALEPDCLAELVVDDGRQQLPHIFHIDFEHGFHSGKIRNSIILGKGEAQRTVLAGARTDQLILEAGDESAGSECDLAVLAAGAGDFSVAAAPLDVDHHDIAARGGARDRLGFPLLLGDSFERPLDIRLGNLDDEPFDVEIGEVGLRDFGQHFEGHVVFEIGPLAERQVLDLWRQCRAQIVLTDRLGG